MKRVVYKTPEELKLLSDKTHQETTSFTKKLRKKKPKNLDGVVNWDAIEAMDERRLLEYARSRGATHLVDYQAYIFNTFYPFFEEGFQTQLVPVTELSPEFPPYGAVEVYEIAE